MPESGNECGSGDFMHDQLSDERSVHLLNVIDDFNRAALDELQGYTVRWQWSYNHECPNMVLNGYTPMQHIQRMT